MDGTCTNLPPHLRSILDTMQEHLAIFDLDGTILFANSRAIELLLPPGETELVGTRIDTLLPPEEALQFLNLCREVNSKQSPIHRQIQCTLPNGSRWFDHSLTPTRFGPKEQPAILCISLDISDQKRQADHIQLSEQRYRRLFENMSDGVLHCDASGRILSMNPAAEAIFGTRFSDLAEDDDASTLCDILHEDGSRCTRANHPVFRVLASGKPITDTLLKIYDPRTWREQWISFNVVPLSHDDNTPPQQVLATVRDMTKRARERLIHTTRLTILETAEQLPSRHLWKQALGRIADLTSSPLVLLHLVDTLPEDSTLEEYVCRLKHRQDCQLFITSDQPPPLARTAAYQQCWQQGQAIIDNDPVQLSCTEGHGPIYRLNRLLAVPIFRTNRIKAILCLASKDRPYTTDDADLVRRIIDLSWEIIEKKLFEEERQEYQRQLQVLIGNLPGMAFRCESDPTRTMRFVSDGCRDLTGHPPEALIDNCKLSFAQLIHPDDRPKVFQAIHEALAANQPYEIRYRLTDARGRIRHVQERGIGVWDNDNHLMIEGFVADVTSQHNAEQKIRETYRQLLAILNGIEAHIYVADIETYEVLFMNRKMQEDFGADLTGLTCWQIFRNEGGPCAHCPNDHLIDSDGNPGEVYVWERKNPVNGRWYVNYDQALLWINNRLVRMQIALDITDRKETEAKLLQSQKMEAIGVLAGGIAHDFNNILSIILGYAGMALESLDPMADQLRRDLEQINRAGLRAQDLVRQILGFSRRSEERLQIMELAPLLKETVKMLRASFPSSIKIESRVDSDCRPVLADASQIHQVLMNLCTNALHAMDNSGRLKIVLELKAVGEPIAGTGQALPWTATHIAVSDTGSGMDAATQHRIFEPFFTTKEQGKGTGLGLSVVQGIVQHHQGLMAVDSLPGKGTTFHIYLPAVAEAAGISQTAKPSIVAGGSEHILVVDDEQQIIGMLGQMLGKLGYTTTLYTDSSEALAAFRSSPHRFDLIISDMTMPTLSGLDLATAIHALRPELPVIICTGYSEVLNEHNAKAAGIRDILQKPVPRATLAKSVRTALDLTVPH